MSNRRWYNPHLPQTLVIAQLLLYFNAVFALIDLLSGRFPLGWALTHLGGIVILAGIGLGVYGAQGIANETKFGYQAAIASAFAPLVSRVIFSAQLGGVFSNLGYVFLANSPLNVLFEYALIALLLHPMSRDHQKVWFR